MQGNDQMIVLVDENDREIGIMEKMEVHTKGLLHRAFSVFIFNSKDEMLLQRRVLELSWTMRFILHIRPIWIRVI